MRDNKLAIVVPCYNEEEIIEYSIGQLEILLNILIDEGLVSCESKICFVNDGSKDKTKEIIENHCKNNPHFALIDLNRNYGQQNAILAGLNSLDADMYVTIDADLQDDYTTIAEMVKKYHQGCEIVYGCRKKRDKDTFFKRNTALLFYKFMNFIGINIISNHSEYRLLDRHAVEILKQYREKTIFLRGIIQNLGLKSANVYYDRLERLAGKTKYSFFKLCSLAINAIVSFSVFPLRMITVLGACSSIVSIFVLLYALVCFFRHTPVSLAALIIMCAAFFSGIIIMSLGIIGEYLSKVLIEVKDRPLYQIEKTINL